MLKALPQGERSKIVVAMSGGVDSSTTAALLHEVGYDVIGVTLQLCNKDNILGQERACHVDSNIYDAQIAAKKIGIPHYTFNYERNFQHEVIEPFVDSYVRGETPIPCVLCNQRVKFQGLLQAAKKFGADQIATGHYARKITQNGKHELHKAVDEGKDQSYFLFTTTHEQLNYLLFPLGNFKKSHTREIAYHYGLNTADKPDSQDICFVPNGDYRSIIAKFRPTAFQPGNIVFRDGAVIGKHDGTINYTIGQRRGLNIPHSEPLYVIKIDPENSEVVVGYRQDLKSKKLLIRGISWMSQNDEIYLNHPLKCTAKLRSTHIGSNVVVKYAGHDAAEVELYEDYFAITPGQACVMYDKTKLLGGGWIIRKIPS
ncbi:tRNA-specific 2-thiouridylase MnmA [Alphaproteobacteria bacterium]